MRNSMIEKRYLKDGIAPSYFLEGMLPQFSQRVRTLIPVSQVSNMPSVSMSACGLRLTVESRERWRQA
jgi:hypothetical protein